MSPAAGSPGLAFASHRAGLPFGWIGRTSRPASRRGVQTRLRLAEAGVVRHDGDVVTDETLIAPSELLIMGAVLVSATEDELHGVAGRPMRVGTALLAAQAAFSTRVLRQALETIGRVLAVTASPCEVGLHIVGDAAELTIQAPCEDASIRSVMEEMFAVYLFSQIALYLNGWPPMSAFVTPSCEHPTLGSDHPYFDCPTLAGRLTALRFEAALLDAPRQSNVDECPLLEAKLLWLRLHPAEAGRRLSVPRDAPLSGQVLDCLLDVDMNLSECRRRLDLTETGMRRGLAREGSSYRVLRRRAIIERAGPPLLNGTSLEDLAMLLGYSDARSLRRALKSATGLSITQLRTSLLRAPPARLPDRERLYAQWSMSCAPGASPRAD